jgi:flagellar biosynthesis/type III secretory pathway chaperone
MRDQDSLITALEDALVKEYRTCQALYNLTKDERQALVKIDLECLSSLVEQKEALLDEMGQLDDQRRMLAQELASVLHMRAAAPSIAEIAAVLNSESGKRISRLREGIVALTADIRDLTSGNQALATAALERADAIQGLLLDLYRPNLMYQPPGKPAGVEAGPSWGVDQRT